MTLAPIVLGNCVPECHTERGRDKEIAVFDAQVCDWSAAFLVTGEPKCEGRCDPTTKCTTKISYFWEIIAMKPVGSALIVGSNITKRTKVRATKQLGTYTLELTVTLQCRCHDKDVGAPLVQKKQREFQVNQNCH